MLLFRHVWLLVGLMSGFGSAETTANLGIWDVDKSCDTDATYLQESMDVALGIATAAQDSLNFVLQKQPNKDEDPDGYLKWNRIYRAAVATLGFAPRLSVAQSPSDQYFSDAFRIFDKIVATLPSAQNDPADGYVAKLKNRDGAKPKIICGDDAWDWLGLEDKVPGKSYTLMQEKDFAQLILDGREGAWYNDDRWVWKNTEREKPVFCRPGLWASVYWSYDMIVFCDRMFTDKAKSLPSPKTLKASGISENDKLGTHAAHLSVIMVHELTHWYGGVETNTDGSLILNKPIILDQTAVDVTGKLIYHVNGKDQVFKTPPSDEQAKKNGWDRVLTYGQRDVWNLAKTNKGSTADNSGPKKALKNADSLSLFALMMYLDEWDWSDKGEARIPGKKYKRERDE
ncbi:hypothetical protein G7Z17_g2434 [Cylindrodendrum hubeiense]|uniref:Uncharacterized protein n=1 Tax=Cylindrodendrum hubeiense TaxID=595255 RepID=A0A9P5HCR6_9HYPO|nr:hypothetical protein G7Z17_g2434 [Cylindrodendrum hubeiense]